MAERVLRRGLPRVTGGPAWPSVAGSGSDAAAESVVADPAHARTAVAAEPPAAAARPAAPAAVAAAAGIPTSGARSDPRQRLRQGLPRTSGAGPWPLAESPVPSVSSEPTATVGVRRGLPRRAGGEPWPPAESRMSAVVPEAVAGRAASDSLVVVDPPYDASIPLPYPRTVFPGAYAFARPPAKPEPRRLGPFTRGQWAGAVVVGGGGLLFAAAMAVLFVRWMLSLPPLQDFLTDYPGEYALPPGAPVGFPPWLGWQHFFNVFLMVLIIRSGWRVRTEKRPTVFWLSRRRAKVKISLTLWFHQALDVLWLVNGVVFVALLFVTGQWMRVVPTSVEVLPNALSAALQYVSLDWPTENGWVNYNALQQLAYGATIFIAAPLAAVSGYRMSALWPRGAERWNRLYPVEWARAVHFPVMLYFVAFITVHVALVLSTGALRNLNHMYAAQGSVDPNAYADNPAGFWLFVLSLAVIVGAWVAARPLVLAPIARLFGTVSGR